jgi:hypothetical protein
MSSATAVAEARLLGSAGLTIIAQGTGRRASRHRPTPACSPGCSRSYVRRRRRAVPVIAAGGGGRVAAAFGARRQRRQLGTLSCVARRLLRDARAALRQPTDAATVVAAPSATSKTGWSGRAGCGRKPCRCRRNTASR